MQDELAVVYTGIQITGGDSSYHRRKRLVSRLNLDLQRTAKLKKP